MLLDPLHAVIHPLPDCCGDRLIVIHSWAFSVELLFTRWHLTRKGFPGGSVGTVCLQCQRCRRHGFKPESGRSPGGGHGNPPQYSCLENPWTEESGGLQSTGSQSQTRLRRLSTHACASPGSPHHHFQHRPSCIDNDCLTQG